MKKLLYERDYFSLEIVTQKMVAAARVLVNDIPTLERQFPKGFGTLASALRGWRHVN